MDHFVHCRSVESEPLSDLRKSEPAVCARTHARIFALRSIESADTPRALTRASVRANVRE
jgi:hypothetical protein